MDSHSRTRHHKHPDQTKFIRLDKQLCQACWNCIEVCTNNVFGKIYVLFGLHKHARIDQPELCKGCKKCVQVCPGQALTYIYQSPNPIITRVG
jgi:ferredoxin